MSEKVLSVSIAAYNVKDYIRETLDCFVGVRGAERLDVMIVDDGGKDETPEIAQEYVDKYPEIFRLIRKENGGWGSTVNTGIRNAKGKYFKLCDGDDYFVREHLPYFLDGLEALDTDIVLNRAFAFEHETNKKLYDIIDTELDRKYTPYELKKIDIFSFEPSVYNVSFKTEMIQKGNVEITEHCFYTDVEYVLKSCSLAKTISEIPLEIYCYRKARSGQSMSLDGVRKHYMDHYKMLKVLLEYDKNEVKDRVIHDLINVRLIPAINNMYKWFLYLEPNEEHKQQLMEFDTMLKEQYPKFYHANTARKIGLLRRSNFKMYEQFAKLQLQIDSKRHADFL